MGDFMIQVIDIADIVRDRKDQERSLKSIKGVMLHRCGVNGRTGQVIGETGIEVAEAFIGRRDHTWRDVSRATGRQNAYTFMVGTDWGRPSLDGLVWQTLALDEVGWHGRRFSRGWVGCAWIADPRVRAVSSKGYSAMVQLVALLCLELDLSPDVAVMGHGEVPGAHGGEKAPGEPEACPGLTRTELDEFRIDVAHQMAHEPLATFSAAKVRVTDP